MREFTVRREPVNVSTFDDTNHRYIMGRATVEFTTTNPYWLHRLGEVVEFKVGRLWARVARVAPAPGRMTEFRVTCEECAAPVVNNGRKEQKMAPKNRKTPRFYVASVSISRTLDPGLKTGDAVYHGNPNGPGSDYVKFTEKEAIDQARALVEQDGIDRYVVKIVRRVRRAPRPVVVEAVK